MPTSLKFKPRGWIALSLFLPLLLLLAGAALAQPAVQPAADRPGPAATTSGATSATASQDTVRQRLARSGLTASDIATTFAFALKPENVRIISLQEVVRETLANNLSIRVARVDREIAGDEINLQLGIYDPVLAAKAYRNRTDEQSAQLPTNPRDATGNYVNQDAAETGISQLTPLGSIFSLNYHDSNTNVMDSRQAGMVSPYYQKSAGVSAVQPLLKNFGPMVTNAGIRVAKRQKEASRYELLTQIDAQMAAAMRTYWDLVFAVENLSVQQLFLKQAEDLLRVNTIKYNTGVLSQTDVLQAKAQVAARVEQVIIAQSQIIGVQDQLKRLMNTVRSGDTLEHPLIPEDLPSYDAQAVQDQEAIEAALANRPELQAIREYIEIAKVNRDVTDWQKLPELNLFAGYNVNGMGGSNQDAFNNTVHNDYNDYQFGAELKYAIGNRKAKYTHAKAIKELDKVKKRLEDVEAGVILEVRNSIRQVRTNIQRILASRTAVESEDAKLQSELKRYDVGMATSFEVLTFQKDLANARVSYLLALIDYKKSLIEYDRVRSALRERLAPMGLPIELVQDETAATAADESASSWPPESWSSAGDKAHQAENP